MRELSVINGLFKELSDITSTDSFRNKHKTRVQSFTRNRKLSFEKIMLFNLSLPQRSLSSAIDDFLEMNLAEESSKFSKQAFSQARKQIDPEAFHEVLTLTSKYIESHKADKKWHGYRILAIDGTTLQLPESKANKEYFGANKNSMATKKQETTMAKATALFDVTNDLILDVAIGRRYASERTQAIDVLKNCPSEAFNNHTIVLFDRGYPTKSIYNFFFEHSGHFLMRISENIHSKSIKNLPRGDNTIDYNFKGQAKKLRVIRFKLKEETDEYLITNVLDKQLSVKKMKELYFLRWGIECKYKELKSTLKIENFSGTSPLTVLQEFYATLIMSNIIAWIKSYMDRILMMKNYIRKRKRKYQINRSYLARLVTKKIGQLLKSIDRTKVLDKIIELAIKELSIIREDRSFGRDSNSNKSRVKYSTARRTSM